jgi:hypothetical protein
MNRVPWRRMLFDCALALCLAPAVARATAVDLGVLSYDVFIPGGAGSPGVDAFDIANFTGAFSVAPDYPVTDSLTFQSASLTLFPIGSTPVVIALGDIGPGFLLDAFGNPIVQVPDTEVFTSAEFTATLSPASFALAGGGTLTASSTAISTVLIPSNGATLTAGVDSAFIETNAVASASTPEPASLPLVAAALLLGAGLVKARSRRLSVNSLGVARRS